MQSSKRQRYWLIIVLLALGSSALGCSSSKTLAIPTATAAPPHPSATSTSISGASAEQAYLDQLAASGSLTGSVLLAHNGTIVLSKGYGLADEASSLPNTPQTRFRIGSISKQFTALAILLLQDRGKLHVSDPVCRFITPCPSDWEPITLQHLLTHSSGIPDYTNFPDFPDLIGTPATPIALIDRFRNKPLEFTPGAQWSYSNSNYVLLGYIIAELAGEDYATFLQHNIFTPLAMANTGYDSNNPPLPAHATGYLTATKQPVYLDMSEFYAAGALYSTVEDLYRWDEALLAGKLVAAAGLKAMFTPQIACPQGGCTLSSDIGYGYGWFIAQESGHTLNYHWGRIDGFRSSNGFFPDEHSEIIILSNLETTDTFGLSQKLADMLVGAG